MRDGATSSDRLNRGPARTTVDAQHDHRSNEAQAARDHRRNGVGAQTRAQHAGAERRECRAELVSGRIGLEPWDADMLQPSSIDIRLDKYFRVFENHRYTHIDPAADQSELTREVCPDRDDPFILHPGEFALGSVYERVSLPDDVAARVEGKSSLGRLGLLTHATAGFIDPGFTGPCTIACISPLNNCRCHTGAGPTIRTVTPPPTPPSFSPGFKTTTK